MLDHVKARLRAVEEPVAAQPWTQQQQQQIPHTMIAELRKELAACCHEIAEKHYSHREETDAHREETLQKHSDHQEELALHRQEMLEMADLIRDMLTEQRREMEKTFSSQLEVVTGDLEKRHRGVNDQLSVLRDELRTSVDWVRRVLGRQETLAADIAAKADAIEDATPKLAAADTDDDLE